MIRPPPKFTLTVQLFPYTTRGRSFLAGEDLRAPADLRPVAGALCDQLRVRARSGLPAAAAVDGSGLSRLLRAGGRLPRGQPRPEERADTDLHRLRRGA